MVEWDYLLRFIWCTHWGFSLSWIWFCFFCLILTWSDRASIYNTADDSNLQSPMWEVDNSKWMKMCNGRRCSKYKFYLWLLLIYYFHFVFGFCNVEVQYILKAFVWWIHTSFAILKKMIFFWIIECWVGIDKWFWFEVIYFQKSFWFYLQEY